MACSDTILQKNKGENMQSSYWKFPHGSDKTKHTKELSIYIFIKERVVVKPSHAVSYSAVNECIIQGKITWSHDNLNNAEPDERESENKLKIVITVNWILKTQRKKRGSCNKKNTYRGKQMQKNIKTWLLKLKYTLFSKNQ